LSARFLYPDEYGWRQALSFAGVDPSKLEKVSKSATNKFLVKQFEYAKSKNVSDFAILINDIPYMGQFDSLSMLAEINNTFSSGERIFIPAITQKKISNIKMYVVESSAMRGKGKAKFIKVLEESMGNTNVSVERIPYERAKKLAKFKKLNIDFLPFYVLPANKTTTSVFSTAIEKGMVKRNKQFLTVVNVSDGGMFVNEKFNKNSLVIFAMTQCPFGISAENAIIDAVNKNLISKNIKTDIKYIVDVGKGQDGKERFYSLHGTSEWEEAVRQILIKKYYPSKFWKYLTIRNNDVSSSRWQKVAQTLGIDTDKITRDFKLGEQILKQHAKYVDRLEIAASPTFLWQGREVITGLADLKKIKEFKNINIKADSPQAAGACR